jgi:hypothetical protein
MWKRSSLALCPKSTPRANNREEKEDPGWAGYKEGVGTVLEDLDKILEAMWA